MIAIGVQMGGPEQKESAIRKSLVTAMDIAAKARAAAGDEDAEAWINPVFIVPGSMLKPQFEGYELGHFSKRDRGLVIQIAVPQAVADGEGTKKFIGVSLREAVRLAVAHFSSRKMSFSALKAEKIIQAIEAGLE